MMSRLARGLAAAALCCFVAAPALAAPSLDARPRVAVISAFEPELALLRAQVRHAKARRVNGVEFVTGELQGRPVLLFLSGISMTNAAMNTQLALDRFHVTHIVFSGIAGGVNPTLHVGDVTAAEHWAPYLDAVYARETAPGQYQPPGWMKDATLPNFGMVHPRPVEVRDPRSGQVERREWFDADASMLEAAKGLRDLKLQPCVQPGQCLSHEPRLVVGGNGVSGSAFVDNAKFREWTFATFQANVLDMETAAVAQVAWSNRVPFLAFRSLSDLAGGGDGENEIGTFFRLAADNSAQVVLAFLRAWKP